MNVVNYLKNNKARIVMSVIGNILVAMGIAIFKFASMGNDPYSGMNMALADLFRIPFPTLQLIVNLILFVIQFIYARKLIGFGTIFNALFCGSMVDAFYGLAISLIPQPATIVLWLAVVVGMLICSFGLSLYQTSDLGVSPYDSVALILDKKLEKIPFFWCRIFVDGTCTLICFCAGGIVGLGTLISAFGFGPMIAFFNNILKKMKC